MRPARPPSLSSRLLRHVLVPLALTWLAGTAVSAGIAYYFTQKAFDRSLLDDAALLATNVQLQSGELELTLTTREVNRVLFDQVETMYFSVIRPDGRVVAGVQDLRLAPAPAPALHRFEDLELRGQSLRAVTLHRTEPLPFDVVVAETTLGRNVVLQRLAWFSLLPQGLLLGVLALWLRRAIRDDLQPLAQLQEALGRRSANDLAPIHVDARTLDVATLSAALNALFARLERSVRAQREFAGNVAHELRTPLAGIRALADYGLSQDEPAAWREQLARIAASQARASRLVDQLLDLALALEAEAGLTLEPVELDQLVRDAVLRFLPRADAAGVDLGALGIDAPCRVRADATLVDGILTNLLDNALRYGAATDGQPSTVTVSIERQGEQVVLAVQDNGPGLPEDLQAQLVQRGAQGEIGQLLGQGAGIGLALVSQYATLMNAGMALGSGPGGQGWQCQIRFRAWSPST
ncbi:MULTISPECIES: sensor histidine kinase [Ramlibacter]|uniref:histidine kinase n=1 Tax=Ramlibacter pinisoli TaxID=2682844 RepID=A0A6N8J0B0_9BURK|nr:MULTISPECIES: sensor histidine kinase [Ramlibacter]MBA2962789.1 sensor histidine kinase [Ramlibacter sp. CGMCC 1.13660]MVQ32731.1 histidine kinase [Ramlibacter pinisoli]